MKRKQPPELTLAERIKIEKLKNMGLSAYAIGDFIGRGKQTIVTEFSRSGGRETYNAEQADKDSKQRRVLRNLKISKGMREEGKSPSKILWDRLDAITLQLDLLYDEVKNLKEKYESNNKL